MKVRGCTIIIVLAVISVAAAIGAYIFLAISLPKDAPKARMFRTEADLRALMTAVETYQADLGAYPPAGPAGLDLAVRHLSRNVDYMPGGAPQDAWGQPYQYVPHDDYAKPESAALEDTNGGYYAPKTYQLYSFGADGQSGANDSKAERDNITSWDKDRSWRTTYRDLQRDFMADWYRKRGG